MNLYDYRKQIHKIYNESVYGNTKGDIYNELSELRLDNNFIDSVVINNENKTVLYKLTEGFDKDDIQSLLDQVQSVIELFVTKNLPNIDEDMSNFLKSNLTYDHYILNDNLIIQL